MYLLATCTSRFEKHHLSSSTHFQSNLFHVQFLIHSGYQLLSDTQISNTFSFLENFHFLMLVSFLCYANDVILLVNACVCSVLLERNKKMSSHFSILKNFPVFSNFRPCVSRCWLNEGREGSALTPLRLGIWFSQHRLQKTFLSPVCTLSSLEEEQLAVDAWASRPALTVVCLSAVCCACHCNYCGFGLCETKQCNASCFVLFVQDCFGNQPFFRDAFLRCM